MTRPLFTPEYYAQCVECYDGDTASHDFLDFCVQELNENLAHLALIAWPNAIGREHAWSALSFPLKVQWGDKVSINDEEAPKTETAPPVPNPMTVDYCVEVLAEGYTREQVESWVKDLGLDKVAVLASHTAEMRYKRERHPDEALFEIDEEPVSNLVEAFERQFSQEEAEAISAGFDGDVKRASKLYRELTEDYVSSMSVEDLIKAGKG